MTQRGSVVLRRVGVSLAGTALFLALTGCQACVADSSQPDREARPVPQDAALSLRPRLASPLAHLMLRIHDAGDGD
jgi:hypothetical protein